MKFPIGQLFKRKCKISGQIEIFILAMTDVNSVQLINLHDGHRFRMKPVVSPIENGEINYFEMSTLTNGKTKEFVPIGRESAFMYLYEIKAK